MVHFLVGFPLISHSEKTDSSIRDSAEDPEKDSHHEGIHQEDQAPDHATTSPTVNDDCLHFFDRGGGHALPWNKFVGFVQTPEESTQDWNCEDQYCRCECDQSSFHLSNPTVCNEHFLLGVALQKYVPLPGSF